ncbi:MULTISPECIES: phage tail protein [unclassified Halomonas]|uniref:phage tail protein n=1 Tax=unclassified Halomonas TaxID=2609666 RepID=UPI002888F0DF|nr:MULTISPECIES: phage tail protein [unclassified Halomonas]MDT0501912.1 phage tail protein [Halomonas sp. PAR7]MDT0510999.1 phage tail protein [Halomonas sp. LES1]MDT0592484.1 phage tail protein [Halomonas sp. PAR8]
MKKLHLLRKHLIAAVPALARDPDRLLTFVEEGSIEFHRGPNLSHEYAFAAQLVLTDFAEDLDTVMLPLLQWLAKYQPDVDPGEALTFEAEILSNDAVDLALRLRLSERVIARVDCDSGRIEAEHVTLRFERDTCPAAQWQLYTREPGEDDWALASAWEADNG